MRCSRCSPIFRAARCWWWAAARSPCARWRALLQAGVQVQIHAYALHAALSQWLAQGAGLRRREGDFEPAWLDEVWLVVAATDDRAFNARLAAEAGRRLASIVDDAELPTLQIPAIMDRARGDAR